ncbi:MAG: hypothetical protein EOP00_03395 [Pedobacter sp.]|nr:MAG: hypothetical protein EOP00_03395 [Pedobacter sp.]
MKIGLILIMFFAYMNPIAESELIKIRNLYEQAAVDEAAHLKLNKLLEVKKDESPLFLGYKGAGIMIGANYAFNPISKLNKFNKGKKLIEQAIARQPKNLELRYLRFTIQTNLPKFLGYSAAIKADKEFVINQLTITQDVDLRDRIVAYLIFSKSCNADELKKVMVWKNK